MRTRHIHYLLFIPFIFCACDSGDGNPVPAELSAPKATITLVDDPFNNGDGSDLLVAFNKGSDETLISEYRIMVVKNENAGSFNLTSAEALPDSRYVAVTPNGNDQEVSLSANLMDADGTTIAEGRPYVVFILSVADGDQATLNSLSTVSSAIELAQHAIKITYMGNMGFLISDGSKQVIIDGLHGNLTRWYQVPQTALNNLQSGRAPFGPSDIAMTTHAHSDHYAIPAINTYLASNINGQYLAPPQARSGINGSRVASLSPVLHTSEVFTHNDIRVEVLHAYHFDQFGNDFSGVENYMYVVEIGGLKVLHMGDVRYSAANLSPFNLKDKGIDVVIIPTFNTLISMANNDLIKDQIDPKHIIATHLQSTTAVSTVQLAFPQADVFTLPLGFKRY
ncbi:MAG: hypothetical protein HEP71_01205 [Roseivirga sp.]|nr:hypothetical protein [Roseivirga sp.]